MFELNWHGKPLHELDYEESVEFEKEIMKRMLSADRHRMSDQIIEQLKSYLEYVKIHKEEQLQLYNMGLTGKEEKEHDDSYSLIIGEPMPEPEEDED